MSQSSEDSVNVMLKDMLWEKKKCSVWKRKVVLRRGTCLEKKCNVWKRKVVLRRGKFQEKKCSVEKRKVSGKEM